MTVSLTPGPFVLLSEGYKLREKTKLLRMLEGIVRGCARGIRGQKTPLAREKNLGSRSTG